MIMKEVIAFNCNDVRPFAYTYDASAVDWVYYGDFLGAIIMNTFLDIGSKVFGLETAGSCFLFFFPLLL